jgi:hypothetical protein
MFNVSALDAENDLFRFAAGVVVEVEASVDSFVGSAPDLSGGAGSDER